MPSNDLSSKLLDTVSVSAGTKAASGLPVSVIFLREGGARISKARYQEQLARPASGLLVLDFWTEGSSFRRPVRQAILYDPGSPGRSLMPPLFEPQVISIDQGGITLVGIQINSQGGTALEVSQIWIVKPAF